MLRLAAFTLASVLAAVALVLASPAAAHNAGADKTKCGDGVVNGSGWYRLKATNTGCKVARKLADHYVFVAGGEDDGFKGWTCHETQIGDEVWRVHCLRNKDGRGQVVRFLYGA